MSVYVCICSLVRVLSIYILPTLLYPVEPILYIDAIHKNKTVARTGLEHIDVHLCTDNIDTSYESGPAHHVSKLVSD